MMVDDTRGMTKERKQYIDNHQKMMKSTGEDLPYKIGIFKPKFGAKAAVRDSEIVCDCGKHLYVSRVTHAIICPNCKSMCVVKKNE